MKGRDWGDAGFIHLCFDALDMDALKNRCQTNGFPLRWTVPIRLIWAKPLVASHMWKTPMEHSLSL
ncbi:MAG: hypothetical protein R2822_27105 [Spirosomataceae bacterium]